MQQANKQAKTGDPSAGDNKYNDLEHTGRIFKLLSMILVATAMGTAFCLIGGDEMVFWAVLASVCIVSISYLAVYLSYEKEVSRITTGMMSQLNISEKDSLTKFPAPALICDESGIIAWYNKAFAEQIYTSDAYGRNLSDIIDADISECHKNPGTVVVRTAGHYRIKAVATAKKDKTSSRVSKFALVCFEDISELITLTDEYAKKRSIAAFIMIDSSDELMSRVKESDKALITMQIDKLVEDFTEEHHGVLKKYSADRYFLVITEEELEKLEEDKFRSLLDEAHKILISDHIPVTLSVGIGRCGANLRESEQMALKALDMTQGRGGDQVAIRNADDDFTFYGGTSKGIEKNSKVKTRGFANSLLGLIEGSDNVVLMGHSNSDFDAVGAAAGLCGAIRCMGKSAWVYTNYGASQAKPIIERLRENLDEGGDIFISEETALQYMNENGLLIVVDTTNKDKLDSRDIYAAAKKVVYIDHHRQVINHIDNDIINLHEPFASSASELVSEVIQYFPMTGEFSCYYADALLSGIMLDTKNFVMKTGIRTFEAAVYLKKLGADSIAVKKLFSSSITTGILRSQLVENARIIRDRCAVSHTLDTSGDIRIASAQAADELLNIDNVEASFVIYPAGNGFSASARSYGDINVQVIMERLGSCRGNSNGGGHQTMAGVYIPDITIEEVMTKLEEVINEFIDSIS